MENLNLVEVHEIPKLKKKIEDQKEYIKYLEKQNDNMSDLLIDLRDEQEKKLENGPIILNKITHDMCVICGYWKEIKELDICDIQSRYKPMWCNSCRK